MSLLDSLVTRFPLLLLAFTECVVIVYVYGNATVCYFTLCKNCNTFSSIFAGVKRFSEDIKAMVGFKPNKYWVFCWAVSVPILTLVTK